MNSVQLRNVLIFPTLLNISVLLYEFDIINLLMCFTEFRFSSACLDGIIIVSPLCDLSAKSKVGTI